MNNEPLYCFINRALKLGTLPVVLSRVGKTYAWRLPSKVTPSGGPDYSAPLSNVYLCDFGSSKMRARFDIASRYMAQVYPDSKVAFINLRWVLRAPNWCSRLSGTRELARAMQRAGIL